MCAAKRDDWERRGTIVESQQTGGGGVMKENTKRGKRKKKQWKGARGRLFIHSGDVRGRGSCSAGGGFLALTKILLTVTLSNSSFSLAVKSNPSESIQTQARHRGSPGEGLGAIMMTVTQSNKFLSASAPTQGPGTAVCDSADRERSFCLKGEWSHCGAHCASLLVHTRK